MAERRPNSVLFSLKELRRIEDDRVKQEEEEEKRRREAEQRAKEEAIRRAQEEAERKRREEEERIRQAQEEAERRAREEQLRLQEAERRARVEAEMKLEQSRIAMEIEAAARAKKLPWPLIGTIIGVLVLGVAALAYFGYQKSKKEEQMQAQLAKERQEAERIRRETEAREKLYQEQRAAMDKKIEELTAGLALAKSDAQREAIRKQIAAERERSHNLAVARAKQREAEKRAAKKIRLGKCPPSDPLCGIE